MRRLFFTLWPPADVRTNLHAIAQQHVQIKHQIPPQRLHLTLRFLGDVSAEHSESLLQAVGKFAVPAFSLRLQTLDYFAKPKIFWLGPVHVPPEIGQLVQNIDNACQAIGVEHEQRTFRPHVSLARNVGRPDAIKLSREITWRVSQFSLSESLQGIHGPQYRDLASWPLTGV